MFVWLPRIAVSLETRKTALPPTFRVPPTPGEPPWLNSPACCELPMKRSPVAVTVPVPVTGRATSPVAWSVAPLDTETGPPAVSPLGRTSVPWLTAIGPLVTLIELNVSAALPVLPTVPKPLMVPAKVSSAV